MGFISGPFFSNSFTHWQARLKEKKEQEDLQEANRLQAEKSKTEKLLQAKLPPPLLTKSVEIQKEKVAMLLSYT